MDSGKTSSKDVENALNHHFKDIIDEIAQITILIEQAKTNLKRQYYKKKLDKLRHKMGRLLFDKAIVNPGLLKKKESGDE